MTTYWSGNSWSVLKWFPLLPAPLGPVEISGVCEVSVYPVRYCWIPWWSAIPFEGTSGAELFIIHAIQQEMANEEDDSNEEEEEAIATQEVATAVRVLGTKLLKQGNHHLADQVDREVLKLILDAEWREVINFSPPSMVGHTLCLIVWGR